MANSPPTHKNIRIVKLKQKSNSSHHKQKGFHKQAMITEVQQKLYKSRLLSGSYHCATVLCNSSHITVRQNLKTIRWPKAKDLHYNHTIKIHRKISHGNYANVCDSADHNDCTKNTYFWGTYNDDPQAVLAKIPRWRKDT